MSNNKVYVGNLTYDMTEGELQTTFEQCGTVVSVKIIMNRDTGTSKGFAFIEMSNEDEAKQTITTFNGAYFGGRPLTVTEARPMVEKRSSYSPNRASGYSKW